MGMGCLIPWVEVSDLAESSRSNRNSCMHVCSLECRRMTERLCVSRELSFVLEGLRL